MTTIRIDPVTRIEGHLKIEVEIKNGVVKDAWSSGTMARGFEALLTGKDPRDAPYVTSRFCGVCFSVHQLASARALDEAFGAGVPWGGALLRNLITERSERTNIQFFLFSDMRDSSLPDNRPAAERAKSARARYEESGC